MDSVGSLPVIPEVLDTTGVRSQQKKDVSRSERLVLQFPGL